MKSKQIWVYCESHDAQLLQVSFELVSKAKELSLQGQFDVVGIVIADISKADFHKLTSCGLDRIIKIDDKALQNKDDRLYATSIAYLAEKEKPEIILIGGTLHGRAIAPWIASYLHTGVTADCTELSIDLSSKKLIQTRPAFSGNLYAEILCEYHMPQIATVRPKIFPITENACKNPCQITTFTLPYNLLPRANIIQAVNNTDSFVLDSAEVILAGGRGIGKQGFDNLFKLAHLLGENTAVGATRAAVDLGWVDYKYQIGQSGVIVKPRLYIAFGISGAAEHIAGMSRADNIVSINIDPNAPIFRYSRFKIIGNATEYIRFLIDKVKSNNNFMEVK